MHRHLRTVVIAGLAVALAGACRQGDSPQALAKLDSLSRTGAQRDSLVAEMAYDARVLSDIGTTLARVSIPKGKIRVSAESPRQKLRRKMIFVTPGSDAPWFGSTEIHRLCASVRQALTGSLTTFAGRSAPGETMRQSSSSAPNATSPPNC